MVREREGRILEKFYAGERFLWAKFLHAVFHLSAIVGVILVSAFYYPMQARSMQKIGSGSEESLRLRQLLVEVMDYSVRYQRYYREVYGRYAREFEGLGIPEQLSIGTLSEIRRYYEISFIESDPKRLMVLASAKPNHPSGLGLEGDRLIIDENYRINGNFPVPHPSKKFLAEESDRVLQLRIRRRQAEIGLAKSYWKFEPRFEGERAKWIAVGIKAPVNGMQRLPSIIPAEPAESRSIASIFHQVKRHLSARVAKKDRTNEATNEQEFGSNEIHFLLSDARLAQHIHFREAGIYSSDWPSLDRYSSFRIEERAKASSNVDLNEIELTPDGFLLKIKITRGELIGELFSMNEIGELKQIRYTDILVGELQQPTGIRKEEFGFQISEVSRDDATITEEKRVKAPRRGPSSDLP